MDEEVGEAIQTAGERLRSAREAKGMSIEEIAASTRIPTRHLQSLENSDWSKLPAPTYSVGFARNYATAVGIDRDEIGDQLRRELGTTRPVHQPLDAFEPADPKRVMPKGLVLGALAALVIVALLLTWLSNRQLTDNGPEAVADSGTGAAAAPAVPGATPAVGGPVVITANEPAWIEVKDGAAILKQGELAVGQSFEVPATAAAPVLTTAKPEALRISVGTADAPAIGEAGKKVSNVSLKGADLLKGAVTVMPAPPAPRPLASRPGSRATPIPTKVEPAPPLAEPPPAPITLPVNSAAPGG